MQRPPNALQRLEGVRLGAPVLGCQRVQHPVGRVGRERRGHPVTPDGDVALSPEGGQLVLRCRRQVVSLTNALKNKRTFRVTQGILLSLHSRLQTPNWESQMPKTRRPQQGRQPSKERENFRKKRNDKL